MRQWSILFPGGCEALIHWRSAVERAAMDGIIDPIVVADLDMKNYFKLSRALSQGERIDYFMSHSWHDNGLRKFEELQRLANKFCMKGS